MNDTQVRWLIGAIASGIVVAAALTASILLDPPPHLVRPPVPVVLSAGAP